MKKGFNIKTYEQVKKIARERGIFNKQTINMEMKESQNWQTINNILLYMEENKEITSKQISKGIVVYEYNGEKRVKWKMIHIKLKYPCGLEMDFKAISIVSCLFGMIFSDNNDDNTWLCPLHRQNCKRVRWWKLNNFIMNVQTVVL